MKKQLVIVVISVLLISVGLSGCNQNNQKEQPKFGNMKISSTAFENEEGIPAEFTCDGDDVSPPLMFTNLPNNTKSLALIVDDPDAPMGTWVHWLIWNIPANTTVIEENETLTFPQGKNDFGNQGYDGPCPPPETHRYFFKLYALDTMLDLESGTTKTQLESAMSGHIIEEAQLIGTYGG